MKKLALLRAPLLCALAGMVMVGCHMDKDHPNDKGHDQEHPDNDNHDN